MGAVTDPVGSLSDMLAAVNQRFLRGEVDEERYLDFLSRHEHIVGQILSLRSL